MSDKVPGANDATSEDPELSAAPSAAEVYWQSVNYAEQTGSEGGVYSLDNPSREMLAPFMDKFTDGLVILQRLNDGRSEEADIVPVSSEKAFRSVVEAAAELLVQVQGDSNVMTTIRRLFSVYAGHIPVASFSRHVAGLLAMRCTPESIRRQFVLDETDEFGHRLLSASSRHITDPAIRQKYRLD